MELEQFFGMSYKGTKRFTQWDVPAANATGFGAAALSSVRKYICEKKARRKTPGLFLLDVAERMALKYS